MFLSKVGQSLETTKPNFRLVSLQLCEGICIGGCSTVIEPTSSSDDFMVDAWKKEMDEIVEGHKNTALLLDMD